MQYRKILYISYDGLTDSLGQSQILPYLTNLSSTNFIVILSAEKKQNLIRRKCFIQSKLKKNTNIVWKYISYTKKPPIFSTLIDMLKLFLYAAFLQIKYRFDIVHCRSYIPSTVGDKIAKIFNTKWIFDMRGFWADERVEGNLWPQNKFLYQLIYTYFKKKEEYLLKSADAVVVLTHEAKNIIVHSWNIPLKHQPFVIPCCVDLEHFSNSLKNKNTLKIYDLVYLGSVGTWYLLDEMLDFFLCYLKKFPYAKFLFITVENQSIILEKAIHKNINPNSLVITSAERDDIPQLLEQCKIAVFFIKPSFSKKGSSATKLAELLAMGLPVITNSDVGDHNFIFSHYICGVLIDNFNEKEYNKAIDKITAFMLNTTEIDLRTTAEQLFNLKSGVEKYLSIYNLLKP